MNNALEYQMSERMFNSILAARTESEKKINPYVYVMDVLNREGRFLGKITKLSIYEE